MKVAAIPQEEDRENGDEKQYPDLLDRLGGTNSDALGELLQVLAAAEQKTEDPPLGIGAPAVLVSDTGSELADLARKLAVRRLIHKTGKRLAEPCALTSDSGTNEKSEHAQAEQKEQINNGDRPNAAADDFFQAKNSRVDQIGKENGEKEEDESTASGVEKSQGQGKKKSREDYARSA